MLIFWPILSLAVLIALVLIKKSVYCPYRVTSSHSQRDYFTTLTAANNSDTREWMDSLVVERGWDIVIPNEFFSRRSAD